MNTKHGLSVLLLQHVQCLHTSPVLSGFFVRDKNYNKASGDQTVQWLVAFYSNEFSTRFLLSFSIVMNVTVAYRSFNITNRTTNRDTEGNPRWFHFYLTVTTVTKRAKQDFIGKVQIRRGRCTNPLAVQREKRTVLERNTSDPEGEKPRQQLRTFEGYFLKASFPAE